LILLADPFADSIGFHPQLLAPGFKHLERRVREGYLAEAEFHLTAAIDEQGCASAQVIDRAGKTRWVAKHKDLRKGLSNSSMPYKTVATTFDVWAFNLNQSFAPGTPVGDIKKWLEAVGGIHLYHRGLRVHPYGDPGHDWLDMNLARVRNPELRPSTNNSIGRVIVVDPEEELLQKTDRSGFVENEAFSELRRFAQDALEWMADERIRDRESRRTKERTKASRSVTEARKTLQMTIQALPAQKRPDMERALRRLEVAREREARTLREEVQLYRTLGTVGTTAAVFAHESAKPVTQVEKAARLIEGRGRKALGDQYLGLLENPVQHLLRAAAALRSFATLPLRLLSREKRRIGRVSVHEVIRDTLQLFGPFLADAQINPNLELVEGNPILRGSVAALESILANLITNAVNALDSEESRSKERVIAIRTELRGSERLMLRVLDSGPGIMHLSLDEIWLPGRTTRPGGTGLGLTIVRDSVADLGGKAHAIPSGELGGAEFIIDLPLAGS
jgi:signal transduction histidine kinase